MYYSIQHIAEATDADILQQGIAVEVEYILTDSRKILFPEKSVFFAIPGKRRSGVSFISALYQKQVRVFVVQEDFDISEMSNYPEATFLLVKQVLMALQQLATLHRSSFNYPVIGITGSNGKTIIKEWLYQSLQERYKIVRSPGSYNSQMGVPLSIWQMDQTHTLGIFEAGISEPGEMGRLEKIIQPTIGVLGFMGDAHSESFGSYEDKIDEKLQLFRNAHALIYNADDEKVHARVIIFAKQHPELQLISWGKHEAARIKIVASEIHHNSRIIVLNIEGQTERLMIPFTDEASFFNSMTCVATIIQLGIGIDRIKHYMAQLKPVAMRLELKQAVNGCSLINDSYSSDLSSLKLALDFLSQQDTPSKHSLIISDILQSGLSNEQLCGRIAAMLGEYHIHRMVGIGPVLMQYRHLFAQIPHLHFYPDTDSFLIDYRDGFFQNEAVLLKGSRIFEFEKISRRLEKMVHDTIMEINLNAIRANLSVYRKTIPPSVKLMAMVKAFGYGTGGHEIASLLRQEGVDYLAVAFADEGIELRKAGVQLPIMVMNMNEDAFEMMTEYGLEPELYSIKILKSFTDFLTGRGISKYPVHIKLDTGMHRLGFLEEDIIALTDLIQLNDRIIVKSVFSHFSASEDPKEDSYTELQMERFIHMTSQIEKSLGYSFLKHMANTAAIRRHPAAQFDMVRLGIGLYGIDQYLPVQEVVQLKTTIAQIKNIRAGETVGYGRKAILKRDSRIATVRIGYADGYPRLLSNGRGYMLIHGEKAPVIGNICMDMTMLDITDTDASEGDEVVVFGNGIPIGLMADWAGTIPYEIITGISQRVKRVYFQD